jgi:pyridoxal phosphate enzyme (YggS family)
LNNGRGAILNQENSVGETIQERIKTIRLAIAKACQKVQRDPETVKIVAVSKSFSPSLIKEAIQCGVTNFGENYLQEALPKMQALREKNCTWHFIGHLQKNKAFAVAFHFQLIHSVDSFPLAERLNKAGEKLQKKVPVLLQFKGKPGFGFSPNELLNMAPRLAGLPWLDYRGIMIIAPLVMKPEEARPYFKKARELLTQLKKYFRESFQELSMGMTEDFPVAIEEGATMIRIGRGIFGERKSI